MAPARSGALKVCVLGDAGVGKTSLVRWLAEGRFEELYVTTVGATVRTATVGFMAPGFRRPVFNKLALWEVTGRGRPGLWGHVLRGARGALLVADATRPETLRGLSSWAGAIKRAAPARGAAGDLPAIIVNNKCDLAGPGMDLGPVKELSLELGLPYRLASARSGRNIPAAFSDLAARIARPWAVIGRPESCVQRLRPPVPSGGRFDRWDLSAVFGAVKATPAGWAPGA